MRLRSVPWALLILMLSTACSGGTTGSSDLARAAAVPMAVSCDDAAQLRQQAADDRRHSEESRSDQSRVAIGNRANFFASLAIVAELKCKVTLVEADEALTRVLDTAREAEAARSFYEGAHGWGEAEFEVTRVISMLIQQLGPLR